MTTLKEFYETYPALTLQNKGYETLDDAIRLQYQEQIAQIEALIKKADKWIYDSVTFKNFKVSHKGRVDVRIDYYWSESFCGVGYFSIEEIDAILSGLNK